jgi:mannose-6-phosphate isomerase
MRPPPLYPLQFTTLYKQRVWGGDRLTATLGKTLPPDGPVGESWELVDLQDDQSRVSGGPLAGVELQVLVRERYDELMGPVGLDGGRFPMLVKYIDASQTLSVQVHPDPDAVAELGGRPKSEAWYILDAEPGAVLYLGLREGTSREAFAAAIAGGTVEALLDQVPATPGTLVPVRPGTVHAIGAGVLLAEVQQPSDTTYRVYDWGRTGLDGKPRELHTEAALTSIRFAEPPPGIAASGSADMGVFQVREAVVAEAPLAIDGAGPAVLVGLMGEARIISDAFAPVQCSRGQVILVPHSCRAARLEAANAPARVLLTTFPPEPGR